MNGTVSPRRTFVISRGLEYFTEAELRMQIGASRDAWRVAILKELIDNALDASEVGSAPEIDVEVDEDGIIVADNGPGIPAETIERSLDYNVRVSDKLGYIAPTRGRLGNALKVIWAAPFVATGRSAITVESRGLYHEIEVTLDRIEQRPAIKHEITEGDDHGGTMIHLGWPEIQLADDDSESDVSYKTTPTPRELIEAFAAFNPHATLRLNGETIRANVPGWKKWRADDALVPHWYDLATFRELVAHYVASERYGMAPITVREFVSRFRGLSATAKQRAVTDGFKRDHLHELVEGGDLDDDALAVLLDRMQEASRPPKPPALGVIGRVHLTEWMVEHAGVSVGSIRYQKRTGQDRLPYVIEIAFGIREDDDAGLRIVTGLNWSPTLDVPAPEIREILQEMRVAPGDPVVVVVHLARPDWQYTGRGKETISI